MRWKAPEGHEIRFLHRHDTTGSRQADSLVGQALGLARSGGEETHMYKIKIAVREAAAMNLTLPGLEMALSFYRKLDERNQNNHPMLKLRNDWQLSRIHGGRDARLLVYGANPCAS